jgi:hypothetical protein
MLVGVIVTLISIGLGLMAVWHQRSSAINETLHLVESMRMHGQLARGLYAEDPSGADYGYMAGTVAINAMPQEWLDNGTQIRNPLGEGDFWGYSVSNGSDGSTQYAFWFSGIPRWACADLAVGLAEYGFVQRGIWLNRAADGRRIPIDVDALRARCNTTLTGAVPTLILLGPAPN